MNHEQEKDNIQLVFKEVQKTLNKIGFDRLIDGLRKARFDHKSNLTDETKDKALQIIQIICDEFSVDFEDMLKKKTSRNVKCLIWGICAIHLTNKLNLYGKDLSLLLGRSDGFLSAHKNKVLNFRNSNPEQAEILQKIKSIEQKIKLL